MNEWRQSQCGPLSRCARNGHIDSLDHQPGQDVIYSCPDCDGDLDEDAYAMWCPACERTVPYALLRDDPETAEDF